MCESVLKANSLDTNWVLERNLGSGGYGIVELWKNEASKEKIAIKKCIKNGVGFTLKQKERWKKEVEVLKLLNHPNIVATVPIPTMLQNISEDDLPILCMEYCSHGDLRMVLSKAENSCGIFEQDAFIIMNDISSAVEYLHINKITHRDLKPENIIINKFKGKTTYKLIDLGYAKDLGETSSCASLVGTLNYIAPELFWNKKYSCSVDYWSLGILFYEILSGKRPFLPIQQHTMSWLNHISQKKYNHISAESENDTIVFYDDIQGPINISDCIRHRLVKWFRAVLQWDPKQRGKLSDSNEVVVFSLLKEIISTKVLYIFILPLCKTVSYNIFADTTMDLLKEWIKQDCSICTNSLILTDSKGNLLNFTKSCTLLQLQKSEQFLLAFNNGDSQMNISPLNFSKYVKILLSQFHMKMEKHIRRRCYSEAIFLIKREIELYRRYIIALSIRIDLIYARCDALNEKMQKSTSNANFLVSLLNEMLGNKDTKPFLTHSEKSLVNLFRKIRAFSDAVDGMKKKLDELKANNNNLREFSTINWTENNNKVYNKTVEIFDSLKSEANHCKSGMKEMAIIVIKFLKLRHQQWQDEKLNKFTGQICEAEKKLAKLEQAQKSFIVLANVYTMEIYKVKEVKSMLKVNVLQCMERTRHCNVHQHSLLSEGDIVIYNNLMLHQMLISLMDDMMKQTANLEY